MDKYLTINNEYDIAYIGKDKPISRVARPDFWSQGTTPDIEDRPPYPLPVSLSKKPNVPKYPAQKISDGFRAWLRGLQPDVTAWTNLKFPSSGYYNKGGGEEAPEVVTWAGNFVPVIEYRGKRDNPQAILVATMCPNDTPDPLKVNYKTSALYVHMVMAGDTKNRFHGISSPTDMARHCYTGIPSPDGQGWITREDNWVDEGSRFQLLPKLPTVTRVKARGLRIRSNPEIGDNIIGGLRKGEGVQVVTYFPTWDGLWFEIDRGGWICAILKHSDPWVDYNINYTDFQLDGTIALRPKHSIPTKLDKPDIPKEKPMRSKGIDISYHQGSYEPQDHHDFVIMRAAYGLHEDTEFDTFANDTRDTIPVRGAYHYLLSKHSWRSQVEKFLEITNGKDLDFCVADIEGYNNVFTLQFFNKARQWCKFVAEETGKKALVYTNVSTYDIMKLKYNQDWVDNFPLWIAQYPYYGWDDNVMKAYTGEMNPRLPKGRSSWKFWQMSADGNKKGSENGVGGASVDLNVFNGTFKELQSWLGKDDEEPPEEPEELTDAEKLQLLWEVHPELH